MTQEQKARAYDEALERARANYKADKEMGFLENCDMLELIFPELRESEDERIRKALIDALKVSETIGELKFRLPYPTREECIAYLEKQKEQKEELVYRLNGLMQDYIKEGKDDEEKEHRLKCYRLFWDALEDTGFFEQKEQQELPLIGYVETYYQKGLHEGIIKGQVEIIRRLEEIEKRKAEPALVIKAGQESVAERFAKIVRENITEISKDAQKQFEQLYFEITGTKMYGGYKD